MGVPQSLERPVTPRELATFLKVSPATIRRKLDELPHFRVGNRIRFIPSVVMAHYAKKPSDGGSSGGSSSS